jgi:Sushi repeat (SCR repeat)
MRKCYKLQLLSLKLLTLHFRKDSYDATYYHKNLFQIAALACPRLAKPDHGTILPANCMYGDTYSGERCFLHCPSGYKAVGKRVAVCNNKLQWQPNAELQCIEVRTPTAQLTTEHKPHHQQHHQQRHRHQQQHTRPTIKCPEDMTIVKPKNQETILVRIPRPVTNVNWENYVDTQPLWGKKLESYLPEGATEVTFRARSSHNNMYDMCRVIVNVIGENRNFVLQNYIYICV